MQWASWSDFWAMGGYAFFVWGSYGVTAVLMIAEVILVMRRRRATLEQLARAARMEKGQRNESS
jgi:heme exporter protein D